jgi:hypothetical protein
LDLPRLLKRGFANLVIANSGKEFVAAVGTHVPLVVQPWLRFHIPLIEPDTRE